LKKIKAHLVDNPISLLKGKNKVQAQDKHFTKKRKATHKKIIITLNYNKISSLLTK